MPERLECEVLQKARYINTLTLPYLNASFIFSTNSTNLVIIIIIIIIIAFIEIKLTNATRYNDTTPNKLPGRTALHCIIEHKAFNTTKHNM